MSSHNKIHVLVLILVCFAAIKRIPPEGALQHLQRYKFALLPLRMLWQTGVPKLRNIVWFHEL